MSMDFDKTVAGWKELAAAILKRASKRGIAVQVSFRTNDNTAVKVRKGKLEEIRQSSPAGVSLRVFDGSRSVSGSSSHLERDGLVALVDRLADSVRLVDEDDANGLPEPHLLFSGDAELDLFDPGVEEVTVDKARELALACEQAAFEVDKRITNSGGASTSLSRTIRLLCNSHGLKAALRTTSVGIGTNPIAEDKDGNKYSEGWFSSARHLSDLDSASDVGLVAGRRCVALVGATKVATGRFPVLFEPEPAQALLTHLFECVSGIAVYKNSSFLAGSEGETIASPLVTVIDDPLRKRGIGSAPFDTEGVATGRKLVLDKGVLKFYPCNTFAARRLKRKSTGHASGAGLTSYNLYIQNGTASREELVEKLGTGLVVVSFIGFGFNRATGDFSRGARGFWVEKGKIVHPVHEITVAGNLGQMFQDVTAVGKDLDFQFGTDSPSLLIKQMTVSGS